MLTVPGSEFVFRGSLTFLDLQEQAEDVIANASSGDRSVDVAFDPSRFAVSHDLHQGSPVKVTVRFDGTRYIASYIAIE